MFAVTDTLKHPSASVNPDNHASCNVIETGVLFNLIVSEPKRLFKALIHRANCFILLLRAIQTYSEGKRVRFVLTQKESAILYDIKDKLNIGVVRHFPQGKSGKNNVLK